jgi:hypothetical protein
MFVISTMGIGLALAMILDGMYGGRPSVPVAQGMVAAPGSDSVAENKSNMKQVTGGEAQEPETQEVLPHEEDEEEIRKAKYIELYKKEKEKKERQKQKPVLEEINANAYLGDGSRQSRRLYLLQQAYKASREATPIINVKQPPVDDSDDELASLIDLIEKEEEEEEEEEEEKDKREDFMMLADTDKIKKSKQYKGSRKIVIEPSQDDDHF